MKHELIYKFWGLVSNTAIRAYYAAPRETLQDEFFALHRFALKKAHNARVTGEREKGDCRHAETLCWGVDSEGKAYMQWCQTCGAINAAESMDIPTDQWVAPRNGY